VTAAEPLAAATPPQQAGSPVFAARRGLDERASRLATVVDPALLTKAG
jgi:hypothetical protein